MSKTRKLWLVACAGMAISSAAMAQPTPLGTSFTYQGELRLSGNASTTADLEFTLWDGPGVGTPPAGGVQIGGVHAFSNVSTPNGRFTVVLNNAGQFGAAPFGPDTRWLQVAVRSPAGAGVFTTLGPRQRITGAPAAQFALEAASAATAASATNATQLGGQAPAFYQNAANMNAGTLPGARLSGTYGNALTLSNAGNAFTGSGSGLTGLNASNVSTGTLADARLSSNVALRGAPNAFTALNTFAASVGIGTASPTSPLHVSSAAADTVRLHGAGGFTTNARIRFQDDFYNVWLHNDVDGGLTLSTGTRLALMGGDVGIGTATPAFALDVAGVGRVRAAGGVGDALIIGGGDIPMGLTTEVGGATPLLNLDMNFRKSNVNTASKGAAVRLDSRATAAAIQLITRPAGSTTEIAAMAISDSADTVRLNGPGSFGTDSKLRFQDDFYNVWVHNNADGALQISSGTGLGIVGGNVGIGSNVGIGTNAPGYPLEITTAADRSINVTNGGTVGFGDGAWITVSGGASYGINVVKTTVSGIAVRAQAPAGSVAGQFSGNVNIIGNLTKSSGTFKIDHPLDPANKFLSHSFVESPDMMNIYNGNITTDINGYATITMPDWFEALNQEFRYQLTVVDEADLNTFVMAKVVRKMAGNQFTVRTNLPNIEVSWQVTGIRHDAYAEAHRTPVEHDKSPQERGKYLHPELFGQPANAAVGLIGMDEREAWRAQNPPAPAPQERPAVAQAQPTQVSSENR